METPIADFVTAAAAVSAMGDKLAAAVIAQNLVWVLASLKGDLDIHVFRGGRVFVIVAAIFGAAYAGAEAYLGHRACDLIRKAKYGHDLEPVILSTTQLLFWMRALGSFVSSLLAGLAFWGVKHMGEGQP